MDDGARPARRCFSSGERSDVIRCSLTYGPYAKGLAFQDGYPSAWQRMVEQASRCRRGLEQHLSELGSGRSRRNGCRTTMSACASIHAAAAARPASSIISRRARRKDFYDCIEWAGVQPWSNGKVGLNGISYYGINQWHVASLQPPHLAAMCIWEGAADWYRDMTHHGGILSTFWANWYDMQVKTVQHGAGERGTRGRACMANWCAGRDLLSDQQLAQNRCDFGDDIRAHPLDDDYHRARSPNWRKVKTPFLSAANWGGQGLHPRGNFEGFVRAASKEKWLEAHGIEHWTHFYTDYGRELQLRFFDHFLHGKNNGWDRQPRVLLQVRHIGALRRARRERMAARAHEMDQALSAAGRRARLEAAARRTRNCSSTRWATASPSSRRRWSRRPRSPDRRALKLFVSSSTRDADIFAILRVFAPDLKEVTFQGAIDPHTPIAQGWLRASHRKLDRKLSKPYRPYHSHDEKQPLKRGEVVELDVEIWPTCIVVPTRLPPRAQHPRQGLRIWRRKRRPAVEFQERTERLRPVPARRSARPADSCVRRCNNAALGRPANAVPAAADHSVPGQRPTKIKASPNATRKSAKPQSRAIVSTERQREHDAKRRTARKRSPV